MKKNISYIFEDGQQKNIICGVYEKIILMYDYCRRKGRYNCSISIESRRITKWDFSVIYSVSRHVVSVAQNVAP